MHWLQQHWILSNDDAHICRVWYWHKLACQEIVVCISFWTLCCLISFLLFTCFMLLSFRYHEEKEIIVWINVWNPTTNPASRKMCRFQRLVLKRTLLGKLGMNAWSSYRHKPVSSHQHQRPPVRHKSRVWGGIENQLIHYNAVGQV